MLLGVVAQSLKPVKLLATYVQTDATTPNDVAASCCQQCCVPLHEALDRTFEAMIYRQYM